MGQNFDQERLRTFTPVVQKVSLQDFLPILSDPQPKISKIWKRDTFGGTLVKKTESIPQKERTQFSVARQSKAPFGHTMVSKPDS